MIDTTLFQTLKKRGLLYQCTDEEALKKLPKEYLEAYEMNRNQHLTHKEIAEKLNVSPQTINYRIGQALKLLRVALKDYLPLFILIFGPNFFEQS